MSKNVVTPIAKVVKETYAAILVEANSEIWLPKSQAKVIDTNFGLAVEIPLWLLQKNKSAFDKNGYGFYTESDLFWRRVEEGSVIIQ